MSDEETRYSVTIEGVTLCSVTPFTDEEVEALTTYFKLLHEKRCDIGDTVTANQPGFIGKQGEIVAVGNEGYDWQVRFTDADSDDDTYYFNSDELQVVSTEKETP